MNSAEKDSNWKKLFYFFEIFYLMTKLKNIMSQLLLVFTVVVKLQMDTLKIVKIVNWLYRPTYIQQMW